MKLVTYNGREMDWEKKKHTHVSVGSCMVPSFQQDNLKDAVAREKPVLAFHAVLG